MKDQKKKVKLSELKINEKLTEFRPINIFIVNRYQQNYRSGAVFPDVIVNKKTGLIVSGNHRVTAMLNEYGPKHETTVIFRTYKNDREMFEDFVRENVSHGVPLTMISKKRITCKLVEMGATNEEIANLMNLPVKGIEKIGNLSVAVIGGTKDAETTHKFYPQKRGPSITEPITQAQYDSHIKADRGLTFEEMVEQIVRWCRNGWIETTPENVSLCEELIDHLSGLVGSVKKVV